MKFIPIESFEAVNSLLNGVEFEPGSYLTVQLSAFTCRNTREEKQIAAEIADYTKQSQTSPPISPNPLGQSSGCSDAAPSLLFLGPPTCGCSSAAVMEPEDVDERLVYCVAALNSIYSDDGYNFNVLSESDFVSHMEEEVQSEVYRCFQHLPSTTYGSAAISLWSALREVIGSTDDGCEYFEFSCPGCDPLSHSIFAHTYLLYNKRRKLMVSVVIRCDSM